VVTVTIGVEGMMCGGCEQRVREAVAGLPGVATATAEHIGDEVEVTFDPAVTDVKTITAAITEAGYRPAS
jgi:copper chaperone CopZ